MFDLFSDFFGNFDLYPVYYEEKACKKCGTKLSFVLKTGKTGCDECYEEFGEKIKSLCNEIQKSTLHKGKIPKSAGEEIRRKRRYEELKKKISEAVEKEDYETAAKLHKELKEIGGEDVKWAGTKKLITTLW